MTGKLLFEPQHCVQPRHSCGAPDPYGPTPGGSVWRCESCGQFYQLKRRDTGDPYGGPTYHWVAIRDRKARKIIGSRP